MAYHNTERPNMHRRHFLHSLLAASVLTQTGCITAALMSRALSDGHRIGGTNSGPATSGRRVHNMGRFRLYADASFSQLIIVGENQHWILNTGAERDTLKQVLPNSIKSPAAWLFSNASLAMPANMAQDDAPKVSLRFFSVYSPLVLSPAQQQSLQALAYETDTNVAKDLAFMNQLVKHGALGANEPTLNRILFYSGKAYQALSAPAGFFEPAIAAGSFPEITETIDLNPATQAPQVAFALPASPVCIAASGQISLNGKPLLPLTSRVLLYPYRG